jgi:hypothetical protein
MAWIESKPGEIRKAAWLVILVDMRKSGAKLSDEDLEKLVEWLSRVWGSNRDN